MAIMNNDLLFCRFWKSVIEKPKFWVSVVLTVDKENHDEVTQSRRINIVPEIHLRSENIEVLEYLCRAVIEDRAKLKRLVSWGWRRIDLLDPELLSQAIVRLQECCLNYIELSQTQMDSVFSAIQESEDIKLKILHLGNEDYSKVPPEILASALVKLEDTDILQARLSPNQVECSFDKMANSEIMNIRKLTFDFSNISTFIISNVSPEVFAEALVRVESIVFTDNVIPQEKIRAFFSKIASLVSMRLKSIHLNRINLSSVSPAIFCEAIVKLEALTARKILHPNLATENSRGSDIVSH